MTKPLIAINCDYSKEPSEKSSLGAFYYRSVSLAGGLPILLPIIEDESSIVQLLHRVDGIVLSGGSDINPARYNESRHEKTKLIAAERERFDFALAKTALDLDKPVLAICYGAQLVNVVLGGSLIQDVPSQCETRILHRGEKGHIPLHNISVQKGTKLHNIIGSDTVEANSSHHQAIKKVADCLTINAIAEDDVIEGVESKRHSFVLALQWHPERLTDRREHLSIFQALIEASTMRPTT